ncbi:MAG: Tic22 family protein [Synechococcales bacterium]|nr:Tic22 family protein [Synechococcales bacterium]
MNLRIRQIAKTSVAAGTLLGALVLGGLQALALTPEQITQKLTRIPVFTITDAQGAPLVASPPNGQKGNPAAGVFISQQDAQAFLERLKQQSPEVAKNVKVVPISLAEVYDLERKNQGKQPQLDFVYVPTKKQLDSAVAILKKVDPKAQQFPGTPLFAARAGKDKEKGFLTIQQGNQSVIPMFFDKEQLQALLDRFKQQQPDLANSADIEVFPLEGVLEAMTTQKDPQLEKIVLVPSLESIQFIQTLQKQQPSGQTKPAPQPANKPAAQPANKSATPPKK